MHKIEVQFSQNLARFAVSLFTREWIEIFTPSGGLIGAIKSPSLRGSGLKCEKVYDLSRKSLSPSLRGSGLKSNVRILQVPRLCLPLYEGVD